MIMLSDLKRANGIDLLLTLAIVASSASFVRFLGIEPSPTRTIFVAYALVGTAGVSLLRRGRVPATTTWLALGLLVMAFVGYLAWIPSVGSWISLNIWSEWILCFAFLVFGVAFGAKRRAQIGQFAAQFLEVVNLAIEHDDRAPIDRMHRLR